MKLVDARENNFALPSIRQARQFVLEPQLLRL
jgi:hypothetical protein